MNKHLLWLQTSEGGRYRKGVGFRWCAEGNGDMDELDTLLCQEFGFVRDCIRDGAWRKVDDSLETTLPEGRKRLRGWLPGSDQVRCDGDDVGRGQALREGSLSRSEAYGKEEGSSTGENHGLLLCAA